jgi:hypothetical protein
MKGIKQKIWPIKNQLHCRLLLLESFALNPDQKWGNPFLEGKAD